MVNFHYISSEYKKDFTESQNKISPVKKIFFHLTKQLIIFLNVAMTLLKEMDFGDGT